VLLLLINGVCVYFEWGNLMCDQGVMVDGLMVWAQMAYRIIIKK
jgi:hypothetical protein